MWEDIIRFEKEAHAVRNYEAMFIPGLLQTSEYAAAISEGAGRDFSPAEVEALIGARMTRQTILHAKNAPSFDFLIESGALVRPVGAAGLMYRQLRHLISVASRDNVHIRVLPAELGAHPGLDGPFMLLQFKHHDDLVHLENRACSAFLEETEHVAAAKQSLRRLHDIALSADQSIEFMARTADELT